MKAPRAARASGGGGTGARRPDTAFEARLYALCAAIPRGRVATYQGLALALGSCARAVGGGMRRNPHAPVVPCHRVIASDRSLGGFSGEWGAGCAAVGRKRALLLAEGVELDAQGRVAARCVLSPAACAALRPAPRTW
jgi:methylated-DNA-[protein]-cysteine S-methyltransferase